MAARQIKVSEIVKVGAIIIGILGGVVGVGDRLYAKHEDLAKVKECMVKVETMQSEIHDKVDFMYKAFYEAAKFANLGGGR